VNETLVTMTLIFVVAVLSPLLSDALGHRRVSAVVIEIVGGVLIGPAVLDIAHVTSGVRGISELGLAFLMFFAGFEIDFTKVRGRPLNLATAGWLISAALAVAIGLAVQAGSGAASWTVIGLALATTALAVLMPLWRDAGVLGTDFGVKGVGAGTVGEFGPIVLVGLVFTDTTAARTAAVLVAFVVVAVVAASIASRPKSVRVLASLRRHTDTSSQLPVRVTALILVSLLLLASTFGIDVLLGAFAAGIVVRLGSAGLDIDVVSGKLDAIGYGLLIPIFFVVSGIELDVSDLVHDPRALLRIPVFLAGFLAVRGVPVWLLYRKALPAGQRWPFAFFSATTLPLVVVIAELGLAAHLIEGATAAALEAAAVLSVLVFPTIAFRLLDRQPGGVPGCLGPGAADA
jgi:Kef-type K+ transport system membrane component KefB